MKYWILYIILWHRNEKYWKCKSFYLKRAQLFYQHITPLKLTQPTKLKTNPYPPGTSPHQLLAPSVVPTWWTLFLFNSEMNDIDALSLLMFLQTLPPPPPPNNFLLQHFVLPVSHFKFNLEKWRTKKFLEVQNTSRTSPHHHGPPYYLKHLQQ